MIILEGDQMAASGWVCFAKKQLRMMRARLLRLGRQVADKTLYPAPGIEIEFKRILGSPQIRIKVEAGDLIICHVGDRTFLYEKKFYDLNGVSKGVGAWHVETGPGDVTYEDGDGNQWHVVVDSASDKVPGWKLTDDGVYSAIGASVAEDDPLDYSYIFTGNGVGVPEVFSGIAAKKQAGKTARVLLNQAMEDELWDPIVQTVPLFPTPYTYNHLKLEDSLVFAPYWVKGKPFVSRYTENGIITMTQIWEGADTTLTLKSFVSESYKDSLPQINRIYYTPLDPTTESRRFATVELGSVVAPSTPDPSAALAAATNYYEDLRVTQDVVRFDTLLDVAYGGTKYAGPGREETYDTTSGVKTASGNIYYRRSDPTDEFTFFMYASDVSGLLAPGPTYEITNTGFSTIANDVRKPYALLSDGRMTYVRLRKDTEMTTWNSGLYVADQLIEESGDEEVIHLYTTGWIVQNGPIHIRKTSHQILHAHHGKNFNAAVYRTTRYVSHSDEMLPYTVTRAGIGNCQLRKTTTTSSTTYSIVVNGVITPLTDYSASNTEYQITAVSVAYAGDPAAVTAIDSDIYQPYPWVDTSEDSVNITRIFSSEANGLIIGFDVYPSYVRHDLGLNLHDGWHVLEAVYDDSVWAFPPASDAKHDAPPVREWKLFAKSGKFIKNVPTPKKTVDGVKVDWMRVNGLCLLQA